MANSGAEAVRPQRGNKLTRDRLTLTTYFQVALWGWFVMSIGPTVPLITKQFNISKGIGGLHGTAIAVGAVSVGLVSHRLVLNFGRRPIMLAGSVLMVGGTFLLITGPHVAVTLAGVTVIGIGGNLIINVAQPALSVHHGLHGPAAVTEANAGSAIVGIFGPLAVGGAVSLGWGWKPAILVTAVLGLIAFFLIYPLPTAGSLDGRGAARAKRTPEPDDDGGATGYTPAFWFFIVAVTCGVAIEFSTSFWAADLIGSRTGAGAGIATAALAALFGGMALARVIGGRLALRYAPEKLMIVAFAIAGGGWFIMWTATDATIAFAALFLTGVGFGLHYPLGVALALRASQGRPDAAQAIVAITTGAAVGLAPFVLGALADQFGSHRAFILVPIIILIGGTSVFFGLRDVQRRVKRSRKPASGTEPVPPATEN